MSTFQIPKTLPEAKRYFRNHPDLEAVLNNKKSPFSERLSHLNHSWTIQSTGKWILSRLVKAAAALAHCVGAIDLSKRCCVLLSEMKADKHAAQAMGLYGADLLMPIHRGHRRDTKDVYLETPPSPLYEAASFYQPGRMCRGVSEWFLYLYLKTRPSFSSSEKHIQAVGKVFEQGAPRASALIQSMNAEDISWNALKLRVTMDVLKDKSPRTSIRRIAKKIYRLPKGAYGVYFLGNAPHRINFIRESKGRRFMVDPRWGCIRISNRALLEKAIKPDLNGKTTVAVDRVCLSGKA